MKMYRSIEYFADNIDVTAKRVDNSRQDCARRVAFVPGCDRHIV